jgi:hypothetical protein
MTPPPPKYVVSNRPINQRTSPAADPAKEKIHPRVQGRLNAWKAKHQLGLSLTEQLIRTNEIAERKQAPTFNIIGSLLMAFSGIGLVFAAITKSITIFSLALPGLLLGLFLVLRQGSQTKVDIGMQTNLFDHASLQAFDQALEPIGDELDATLMAQLLSIKVQIVRIAKLANRPDVKQQLSFEDRHYLSESLRRYLPDSLQSYLQVPIDARTNQIGDTNQSPRDLLHQQLSLLQQEFEKREKKLIENTAEQLLHQQRFLEQKIKD